MRGLSAKKETRMDKPILMSHCMDDLSLNQLIKIFRELSELSIKVLPEMLNILWWWSDWLVSGCLTGFCLGFCLASEGGLPGFCRGLWLAYVAGFAWVLSGVWLALYTIPRKWNT